ncbi:MAG TPA: DUF3617 family protein [Candidatus Binatia bacterium]|nr:DUF3617 family protein [Candidatus Binatia bacterium]
MDVHITRRSRPRVAFAGALVILLAAGPPAYGDDWPAFKSGMWQLTRSVEMPGSKGKPRTVETNKCTNPMSEIKKQNDMLTRGGCKLSPLQKSGSTYTYSADCSKDGFARTSKGVLTVEGDDAYSMVIESTIGEDATREVLKGKRLGDCPPK